MDLPDYDNSQRWLKWWRKRNPVTRRAISLGVIVYLLFQFVYLPLRKQKSERGGTQNVRILQTTTHGNSSPVVSQSGTGNQSVVAGTSVVVNQAGRDIYNFGISEAAFRKMLEQRAIEANSFLAERYPLGYALFGIANGDMVWFPRLKNVKMKRGFTDVGLTIDPATKLAHVIITNMVFDITTSTHTTTDFSIKNCHVVMSIVENQPTMLGPGQNIFMEVLDAQKRIFVIGFKDG